jgi:tetratricopeptide (TPR) repeat protein
VADFSEATKLNPQSVPAYVDRGEVQLLLKKHDAALADSSAEIRLDPKNARAYQVRAQVYEEQGDKERAVADRKKVGELGKSLTVEAPTSKPQEKPLTVKQQERFQE